MGYTVEVIDSETQEVRGFLSHETDENPNRLTEITTFDKIEEVLDPIAEMIAEYGETFAYLIDDQEGTACGMVYVEDGKWVWSLYGLS